MNADIPPLKVWIDAKHLGLGEDYEHGYVFGLQSYKGRCLQFHVLLESGAHFRHVPLHWLLHYIPSNADRLPLELLQLWDCESHKPVVTAFNFLQDYEVDVVLKDKGTMPGAYWCTVDWLPDTPQHANLLGQPDQNKCAHLILLANGQIAAQPTNRVLFKDAYFIGNQPTAATKGYKVIDQIFQAETCQRWSVADKDEVFY